MSLRTSIVAIGGLLALLLAACGGGDQDSGAPFEVEGAGEILYRGARVTPPLPKPDLVLTDTQGEAFDILAETEGFLTILYLGYTHCPDICPTHMLDLARAMEAMEPDVIERIRVVFITTDPERDDAPAIRRWLDLWNESFIGLTITPETLATLLRSLGMPPIMKTDLGEGRYVVSHATYMIAYTTDNLGHIVYPFLVGGGLREIMAHDLPLLARDGWREPS